MISILNGVSMKTLSLALLLSLATGSTIASAEEPKPAHPCEAVKSACEAAGFVKGGHKKDKKGLFVDCMQPLMAGQSVAGVSAAADVVAACKQKKEDHHKYK